MSSNKDIFLQTCSIPIQWAILQLQKKEQGSAPYFVVETYLNEIHHCTCKRNVEEYIGEKYKGAKGTK